MNGNKRAKMTVDHIRDVIHAGERLTVNDICLRLAARSRSVVVGLVLVAHKEHVLKRAKIDDGKSFVYWRTDFDTSTPGAPYPHVLVQGPDAAAQIGAQLWSLHNVAMLARRV